jgi:hypothetical protein
MTDIYNISMRLSKTMKSLDGELNNIQYKLNTLLNINNRLTKFIDLTVTNIILDINALEYDAHSVIIKGTIYYINEIKFIIELKYCDGLTVSWNIRGINSEIVSIIQEYNNIKMTINNTENVDKCAAYYKIYTNNYAI